MNEKVYNVRWALVDDSEPISEISRKNFFDYFRKDEIEKILKKRNAVGVVITEDDEIRAYIIYLMEKDHYSIVEFAALSDDDEEPYHKEYALVDYIINRVRSHTSRKKVIMVVNEYDEACQQVLSDKGFLATKVERDFFGKDVDGYEMVFDAS